MGEIILIASIFFLIALVYSSAGFGGGSSYLAVLSLFSFDFIDLRMIALICNIAVVTSSVFLFYKYYNMKWRKLIPLIVLSIPMAFIGGRLKIGEEIFFIILGLSLLVAAIVMLFDRKKTITKFPKYSNGVIGGGIGFLSGVVGIGGGIFLSPFLHVTRWDYAKTIAGTSALFILANSIAGLTGQIITNGFNVGFIYILPLLLAVIIGGQVGVRLTLFKLNQILVKRVTAFVILIVAIRLLTNQLF